MRIAFYTLGCKVNQYETEVLSQLFAADGYDIVAPDETADIYVINSCTVTATGDKKTRQMLRHFKSQNPAAKVALTGCFPQAFPDAAEKLPEADIIMGARGRAELVKVVSRCLATDERIIDIRPHEKGETFERMAAAGFAERTRAFVKIEDGCERYCSYCIIPTARGPVRSKPMDELSEELRGLAASGYQEVVLVGINLSCYGKELGLRLIDAVELACRTDGIRRVRLGLWSRNF
jgi:threonylcarbamoyladenosine tRNA methylthiotransferase MtaB